MSLSSVCSWSWLVACRPWVAHGKWRRAASWWYTAWASVQTIAAALLGCAARDRGIPAVWTTELRLQPVATVSSGYRPQAGRPAMQDLGRGAGSSTGWAEGAGLEDGRCRHVRVIGGAAQKCQERRLNNSCVLYFPFRTSQSSSIFVSVLLWHYYSGFPVIFKQQYAIVLTEQQQQQQQ